MGIIVNRDENRTELQKRIAVELAEKAKKKKPDPADRLDGVEDSQYIKGTKQTTSLAWVWVLIVIFGVAALIGFIIISGNQTQSTL